jgi:hypothetical protein
MVHGYGYGTWDMGQETGKGEIFVTSRDFPALMSRDFRLPLAYSVCSHVEGLLGMGDVVFDVERLFCGGMDGRYIYMMDRRWKVM